MVGGVTALYLLLAMIVAMPAEASYFVAAPEMSGDHDHDHHLEPYEFTFIGDPPTDPYSKWDPGANTASEHAFEPPAGPGTPGGATFSIMGAGFVDVSTYDPGHSGTTMDITSLGIAGYTITDYAADINTALDLWAGASDFVNLGQVADGGVNAGATEVSGGHLGDIRIGAWEIVDANVLAHAFQPGNEATVGSGGSVAGDIHFDINRNWTDNAGGFDFLTVAIHEVGHALGLGHSDEPGSVMAASYSGVRRTLSPDDVAGIQAIYGGTVTVVNCTTGDADCDGDTDLDDLIVAVGAFTGPCTDGVDCLGDPGNGASIFNKVRADGDVNDRGITIVGPPPLNGDGDVDLDDIITMVGGFTGPSDNEGALAASAGDAGLPDLIYDATTGEVFLDGTDIGGGLQAYNIKNAGGGILNGNFTSILGGPPATNLPTEIGEFQLSSTPTPPGGLSIGNVFPIGMDFAALTAFVTGGSAAPSFGGGSFGWELFLVNPPTPGVPEPATAMLMAMGLLGLGVARIRRGYAKV